MLIKPCKKRWNHCVLQLRARRPVILWTFPLKINVLNPNKWLFSIESVVLVKLVQYYRPSLLRRVAVQAPLSVCVESCCIWVMCPSCCISQSTVLEDLHAALLLWVAVCRVSNIPDSNTNFGSPVVFLSVLYPCDGGNSTFLPKCLNI